MKRELLNTASDFRSNTYYYFDKNIFDFYEKDACVIDDSREYTALHGSHIRLAVAFFLKDLNNVTLDFGGATLLLHGKINAFMLINCKNVTIKNVTVKYDRSFFTECDILEITDKHMRLSIDKNKYPYQINDGYMKVYADSWENSKLSSQGVMFLQVFDKNSRQAISYLLGEIGKVISWPENSYCDPIQFIPEQDEDDVILYGKIPENFVSAVSACDNPLLVIAHENRDYSGLYMLECIDTHIEDVRFLNGPGMGISPIHCKDIYIDRLKFTYDEQSDGIATNLADAIHAVACSGYFVIKDSVIEGMIDDALNIHNNFYHFSSAKGNSIIAKAPETAINAYCQNFMEGDRIAVYNGPTLELSQEYSIIKREVIDDEYVIFYVDKPVCHHNENDLIENLTAQPDITITDSVFGKANTHMRFQSRGKIVVDNCVIELPILLTGDASYWLESSPVNNMTIQNCRFTTNRAQIIITPEIMPTEKAPYYHQNVKIINNTFESEQPINAGYVDNLIFKGNINASGKEMTVILKNSGRIEADCSVERSFEVKTELKRN